MSTHSIRSSLLLSISLALGSVALLPHAQAEEPSRSVGTVIDDATITASVKTKLMEDTRTKAMDINVDTRDGVVTLRGGADSKAAKDAATALALDSSGVKRVNNEIVVAAPGTQARTEANTATASGAIRKGAGEVADASGDAWLTTKVKAQLLADSDVNSTDISVETRDNVVHLSGVLPSREMRALAIRIAESTEGVNRVNAERLVVR
ncbi:MAG: BON domain-containing protein [Lysobacteraceae bacterium]